MALTIDVDIETCNAAGDGVAFDGRGSIAVPGSIPGERVRVDAVQTRDGEWRGTIVDVLRPSPHRVTPQCRHFGPCGGCSWQHIAYDEQLRLKSAMVDAHVQDAVPGAPDAAPTLPGVPAGSPWGYRQKVHFVFGSDAVPASRASRGRTRHQPGGLVMGHYRRGSRQVIGVTECPVHDPRGNAAAFALFEAYARAGVAAAPQSPSPSRRGGTGQAGEQGSLKSVAIRVARDTPELMTTIVVRDDGDRRLRSATRRMMPAPEGSSSLHLNIHPRDDGFIFGRDTRRLAGPARLREQVAGVSFLISPTSFFQTNVVAARLLVELVLAAVPEDATVLDLYSGAGLFALPLAARGHRVTAVEENRAAVEDAEASLRLNRIPTGRCHFVARAVEAAGPAGRGHDAVVLDPPREGCSAAVIDGVFGSVRPKLAVYVSCNPLTLGRDLAAACAHGYRVTSVQPVDMFPHTAHIETVVTMERL